MRWISLALVAVAACGSDKKTESRTSGPIESIVHFTGAGVQVYASHHLLELSELPIARFVGGVPAQGTIELGANINVPLGGNGIDPRGAKGRLAFRCVGHCQLGDDHARIQLPGIGAFTDDGLEFSHVDLDGLEAHVQVADGHVRLTEWRLASADLDLDVDLDITLAPNPRASTIDACVRFRPTDALLARDPKLHAMLSLASPVRGPDDRQHVTITGSVSAPRVLPRVCGP